MSNAQAARTRPRWLRARPPMIWTAALLYLCGGLVCLAAAAFPISRLEPVRLDLGDRDGLRGRGGHGRSLSVPPAVLPAAMGWVPWR